MEHVCEWLIPVCELRFNVSEATFRRLPAKSFPHPLIANSYKGGVVLPMPTDCAKPQVKKKKTMMVVTTVLIVIYFVFLQPPFLF